MMWSSLYLHTSPKHKGGPCYSELDKCRGGGKDGEVWEEGKMGKCGRKGGGEEGVEGKMGNVLIRDARG